MAKKAKKQMKPKNSQKKTNVGLKASRFSPLSAKLGLSRRKKVNQKSLAVLLLLLAVVGGLFIYSSHAETKPPDWTLKGSTTVSIGSGPNQEKVKAAPGKHVKFHHRIKNLGPSLASYSTHVDLKKVSSEGHSIPPEKQINNIKSNRTAPLRVYAWTHDFIIPPDSKVGQTYCESIYFTNSSGPKTAPLTSKKACVSVIAP